MKTILPVRNADTRTIYNVRCGVRIKQITGAYVKSLPDDNLDRQFREIGAVFYLY